MIDCIFNSIQRVIVFNNLVILKYYKKHFGYDFPNQRGFDIIPMKK